MDRNTGKEALSTVLNNKKNIEIIENNVFKVSVDEETYNQNLYQVIGDIITGMTLKSILENIKSNKIGWKHSCFEEVENRMKEQDDFIVNPFTVSEGVLKCNKCNSERVFSYTKQTRSGDEATSVFSQCVNCKAKWVS
jgi:DNA-directed RNA polymerase subunit M/transcription elongation factor TFIIS